MRVLRAKSAGFCMGVALALEKLDQALASGDGRGGKCRIVTFGPIIHNPKVLHGYADAGVLCTEQVEDIRPDDVVVIRAHGIPVPVERALRATGAQLVDATCPRVKKAQQGIAGQSRQGRCLLLLGEAEHPEVRGLVSHALPGALVFGSLKELQVLHPDPRGNWFFATQTTQDIEEFDRVTVWLAQHMEREIPVLATICDATRKRQEEAHDLAAQVQAMVVVGGLESGNTRRLAQISGENGVPAFHVESPEQLPLESLGRPAVIGLTAGASTPSSQIDAMQRYLENLTDA